MNILLLVFKLIPTILGLVRLVEMALKDKPQSGTEKKALVMEGVEALSQGADAVFTGGAADTWTAIKPYVSVIIDGAAGIAFPKADPNDPRYSNP